MMSFSVRRGWTLPNSPCLRTPGRDCHGEMLERCLSEITTMTGGSPKGSVGITLKIGFQWLQLIGLAISFPPGERFRDLARISRNPSRLPKTAGWIP